MFKSKKFLIGLFIIIAIQSITGYIIFGVLGGYTEINFEGNPKGDLIATQTVTPSYELWQYGTYWSDGDIKIDNEKIGDDISNLAELLNKYLDFNATIPTEVSDAIADGQEIEVKISSPLGIDTIFQVNGSRDNPSYKIANDNIYIKAYPKFNVDDSINYRKLIDGIREDIPVVHPDFGGNRYSIFNKDTNTNLGRALADNYSLSQQNDGTVHYSNLDWWGNLQSGFDIDVESNDYSTVTTYSSNDLKVGDQYAGLTESSAMSMIFLYPVNVEYYAVDDYQEIKIMHVDINTGDHLTPMIVEEAQLKTYEKGDFENYIYIGYEFYVGEITEPIKVEEFKEITEPILNIDEDLQLIFYYYGFETPEVDPDSGGDIEGEDLEPEGEGQIIAEEKGNEKFNISLGIPTSEETYVQGEAKNYLYEYSFQNMTGEMGFSVTVKKKYELKWKEEEYVGDDENGESIYEWENKSTTKTVTQTHNIKRDYSYWATDYIDIYPFDKMVVENYSLPGEKVILKQEHAIDDLNIPDVVIEAPEEGHIKGLTHYEEVVDLGTETIDGGKSGRPSVPSEDFLSYAESSVGELLVANEYINVNGKVATSNYVEEKTDKPNVKPIEDNEIVKFEKRNLYIDDEKRNGLYESKGTVHYNKLSSTENFDVNDVVIHTPTVMYATIYDDLEFNQKAHPNEERVSIILDRPNNLKATTYGKHNSNLGYHEQDFKKYIKDKQVKFPFDIYFDTDNRDDNTKYVTANTWIDLDLDIHEYDFFVPYWVDEGDYTVEFRSRAINQIELTDLSGDNYNKLLQQYIATEKIDVEVVGRLYGFKVTDMITNHIIPTIDYDVYESMMCDGTHMYCNLNKYKALYGSVNNEYICDNHMFYSVGLNDENGEQKYNIITDEMLEDENFKDDYKLTLPIIPGSSPHDNYHGALKKGYRFAFEINTMGNYFGTDERAVIIPTFYHLDQEGNKKEVDVYVDNNAPTPYNTMAVVKWEDYHPYQNYMKFYNNYRQDRYYEYKEDFDQLNLDLEELGEPFDGNPYFARNKETVIGGTDWIYLNKWVRLFNGITEGLPETVDTERARKGMQTWYGEYEMPINMYLVEKGFDVWYAERSDGYEGKDYFGFDMTEDFWITEGYLMVNFDIRTIKEYNSSTYGNFDTEEQAELSYYNSPNANMWDIEGYSYSKAPRSGVPTYLTNEITGELERQEKDAELIFKNNEMWNFETGDVIVYDLQRSFKDDFEVRGIN